MSDNIFSLCFYLACKRALSILTACHFNGRAFQQANLYCIYFINSFLYLQLGAGHWTLRPYSYLSDMELWTALTLLSPDRYGQVYLNLVMIKWCRWDVVPLRRRAVLASLISCFHSKRLIYICTRINETFFTRRERNSVTQTRNCQISIRVSFPFSGDCREDQEEEGASLIPPRQNPRTKEVHKKNRAQKRSLILLIT